MNDIKSLWNKAEKTILNRASISGKELHAFWRTRPNHFTNACILVIEFRLPSAVRHVPGVLSSRMKWESLDDESMHSIPEFNIPILVVQIDGIIVKDWTKPRHETISNFSHGVTKYEDCAEFLQVDFLQVIKSLESMIYSKHGELKDESKSELKIESKIALNRLVREEIAKWLSIHVFKYRHWSYLCTIINSRKHHIILDVLLTQTTILDVIGNDLLEFAIKSHNEGAFILMLQKHNVVPKSAQEWMCVLNKHVYMPIIQYLHSNNVNTHGVLSSVMGYSIYETNTKLEDTSSLNYCLKYNVLLEKDKSSLLLDAFMSHDTRIVRLLSRHGIILGRADEIGISTLTSTLYIDQDFQIIHHLWINGNCSDLDIFRMRRWRLRLIQCEHDILTKYIPCRDILPIISSYLRSSYKQKALLQ